METFNDPQLVRLLLQLIGFDNKLHKKFKHLINPPKTNMIFQAKIEKNCIINLSKTLPLIKRSFHSCSLAGVMAKLLEFNTGF